MITLKNVSKWYGHFQVLTDCSTEVKKGEVVVVCGPSGSGKSTLIKTVNGLEPVQQGEITVDGIVVNDKKTDLAKLRSRVGMVFQHFELFPHLSIIENLTLAQVKVLKRDKAPAREKALKLLERVGLSAHANKFPAQLSGGQKQRVALARALAVEPQILLLDEPFGALDAQVRKELRRWLRQLHEELKFTSVFVTHDQEEATEVADRVVVMSQGNIEQADAPDQVWREPATRFVLEFMGEVNRLQGTIRGGQFHVGAHRWPLGYTPAYQGPVDLFLRPWEVDISRRTSLDSPLPVQVLEASPKGHYTQLVVQPLGWYNEPLTVVMHGDDAPQRGERLFVGLQHARLYNGDERIETRDEELALAQSA